mmetsp:Transcript_4689/g.8683  ORF Transcript_4689/g.8683 Transcript_4689/m.8683 type:complete len:201 (+) Transcript_4689:97-699(+)
MSSMSSISSMSPSSFPSSPSSPSLSLSLSKSLMNQLTSSSLSLILKFLNPTPLISPSTFSKSIPLHPYIASVFKDGMDVNDGSREDVHLVFERFKELSGRDVRYIPPLSVIMSFWQRLRSSNPSILDRAWQPLFPTPPPQSSRDLRDFISERSEQPASLIRLENRSKCARGMCIKNVNVKSFTSRESRLSAVSDLQSLSP